MRSADPLLLLHLHRVVPLLELELALACLHQFGRQQIVLPAKRTIDVQQAHVLRQVEAVTAADTTKTVDSRRRRLHGAANIPEPKAALEQGADSRLCCPVVFLGPRPQNGSARTYTAPCFTHLAWTSGEPAQPQTLLSLRWILANIVCYRFQWKRS